MIKNGRVIKGIRRWRLWSCGWMERERKKKTMSEAMKKLKESNDEKKIKLAKRLARYYGIFHNIGYITTNPDFPFEEDKYGLHYVYCYLENFVDTAKISITGVIKALADDEQLDPFCKYLMFTHMYIPEQVKEIEHEEIYKREKKFKEDELPGVRYYEDELPGVRILWTWWFPFWWV